jgi:hypothetical protein
MMVEAPTRVEVAPSPLIAEGVRLLDERGPEGWREMIDPECLDIASRWLCVYGQLYGGYAAGTAALELVDFEEAQRCGFTSRPGGYAERTDAWKAYLRGVTEA